VGYGRSTFQIGIPGDGGIFDLVLEAIVIYISLRPLGALAFMKVESEFHFEIEILRIAGRYVADISLSSDRLMVIITRFRGVLMQISGRIRKGRGTSHGHGGTWAVQVAGNPRPAANQDNGAANR
jgi:hypothetical protein